MRERKRQRVRNGVSKRTKEWIESQRGEGRERGVMSSTEKKVR